MSAIGLGEMPMSVAGRPDPERAIATVHAALDAGVTLIDTADAYSLGAGDFGHGEALVARALRAHGGDTSEVVVATKGGHTRGDDGSWSLDGRPGVPARRRRGEREPARRRGDRPLPAPPPRSGRALRRVGRRAA